MRQLLGCVVALTIITGIFLYRDLQYRHVIEHLERKIIESSSPWDVLSRQTILRKSHKGTRPIAIFVLGVEGVGHHMLMPALEKLPCAQRSFIALENSFFLLFEAYIPMAVFQYQERALMKNLRHLYNETVANNKTHVNLLHTPLSFPYYRPENSINRPDILYILHALEEAGFDVRFVVLVRDIVASINSVLRRQFTTTEILCRNLRTIATGHAAARVKGLGCDALISVARTQEDNLMYINSALSVLDPSYWTVVDYDELLASPEVSLPRLARFLEVDASELLSAVNNTASHRQTRVVVTPEQTEFLRERILLLTKKLHLMNPRLRE